MKETKRLKRSIPREKKIKKKRAREKQQCGEAAKFIMDRSFMIQEFIIDGLFTDFSKVLSAVPLGIAFQ